MEFNILISELKNGCQFDGFYVLKEASIKTTSTGKPYINGIISDKTGSIDFKIWDYVDSSIINEVGKVVKVRGEVAEFKGNLQVNVAKIRLAQDDDIYDIEDLVPVAPIDREKAIDELYGYIDSIDDEDYKNICHAIIDEHIEKFKVIPAAKSVHHSFISGLLMHTINMLKIADFLSGVYSDFIVRDLLIAGTMLHDFMKEEEYSFSDLGIAVDYSTKGQLLGHLVMGAEEVAAVAKEIGMDEQKSMLLQHLILSHHGEPEFGAAVKPMCAEAELLSYIDLLDSRMEIYAENLLTIEKGKFSQQGLFALGGKKIYNHN